MINAYKIAVELCKVKSTASGEAKSHITPRVEFILKFLHSNGIPTECDFFETHNGSLKWVNVHVHLKGETDNTIVYLAHHDIVNPDSDNMNDNTASVSHLMQLATMLKGKKLQNNIHICFTDGEERGATGAKRLAKRLNANHFGKVLYAINLELTAVGSVIWSNNFGTPLSQLMLSKGAMASDCPPNDSYPLRDAKIDSVCIGIVRKQDTINEGKGQTVNFWNKTWSVCHKLTDSANNVIEGDMLVFTDFLESLAPMAVRKNIIIRLFEQLQKIAAIF